MMGEMQKQEEKANHWLLDNKVFQTGVFSVIICNAIQMGLAYVLFHGSLFGKLERTIKRY